LYGLVALVPGVYTIWLSLNKWSGLGPMEFVGFRNYTNMFRDPVFVQSFWNTLIILVGGGIAVFVISFALTMLLQNMWGRRGIRMIVFFPTLIPAVVVSMLWGNLFNSDGLVNTVLRGIGVENPPAWLGTDLLFMTIVLGIIWLASGMYTVILMAAADGIPKELYEAADLEGATMWQKFRYVTFPMMADVIGVCAVLWAIGALKTFEFFLTFAGSSGMLPSRRVWTFALYSYAQAFAPDGLPNFGFAAASGIVVLICTALLTALSLRASSRRDA
jgi:raffinose/stachyose/melibiose transport system permease protein